LCLAGALLHGLRLAAVLVGRTGDSTAAARVYRDTGPAVRLLMGAGLLTLAVTGMVFVAWGARGYRNLAALRVGNTRYWTAWTVIGWIVPGANLFVPKLVMNDLWRASSPTLPVDPSPGWQRRPVGGVVTRWWALWLAVPAAVGFAVTFDAGDPNSVAHASAVEASAVFAAVALYGAAQAARQMMGIVTVAQARRSEVVAWATAASAP
jgi:hypothetical protein